MNNSRRVTVEGALVALLVVTSAPLHKLRAKLAGPGSGVNRRPSSGDVTIAAQGLSRCRDRRPRRDRGGTATLRQNGQRR
jgi:hypothetical protein